MKKVRILNKSRGTALGEAIQVADTGPTRQKGLLGRAGLAPGEGLWIVPCEAIHMFFMRFAVDAIFVDRQRRVVKDVRDLRPWRMAIGWRARSVIELPVGTIDATGTEKGDQLEITAQDA